MFLVSGHDAVFRRESTDWTVVLNSAAVTLIITRLSAALTLKLNVRYGNPFFQGFAHVIDS